MAIDWTGCPRVFRYLQLPSDLSNRMWFARFVGVINGKIYAGS